MVTPSLFQPRPLLSASLLPHHDVLRSSLPETSALNLKHIASAICVGSKMEVNNRPCRLPTVSDFEDYGWDSYKMPKGRLSLRQILFHELCSSCSSESTFETVRSTPNACYWTM